MGAAEADTLRWCSNARADIESQRQDEGDEVIYRYGDDLRDVLDAYATARHRATLLADPEVERDLDSLYDHSGSWIALLVAGSDAEDEYRALDEALKRLTRSMQLELKDLDEVDNVPERN